MSHPEDFSLYCRKGPKCEKTLSVAYRIPRNFPEPSLIWLQTFQKLDYRTNEFLAIYGVPTSTLKMEYPEIKLKATQLREIQPLIRNVKFGHLARYII